MDVQSLLAISGVRTAYASLLSAFHEASTIAGDALEAAADALEQAAAAAALATNEQLESQRSRVAAEDLAADLSAANEEGARLRQQLELTQVALARQEQLAASLQSDKTTATAAAEDRELSSQRKVRGCPCPFVRLRSPVPFSHLSQVERRNKQLETAQAVAASAKMELRVDQDTREFFEMLMQEEPPAEQKYLRLLIDNQLTTLRNRKGGRAGRCVWHVEVLNWCADVYRRNPGAYEHMALGGFLKLPHPDTVRKRASRVHASSGECRALYDTLRTRLEGVPAAQREMALLFDEINIAGDVAFKVVNGEYRFFGFIDVDAATPNLYGKEPKEISREAYIKEHVATHALVFQVAELSGQTEPIRFRQVVAVYGVTSLNAFKLDELFWEVVQNLHDWSAVRVVVCICDGASCNRLFQKMNTHQMGKGTPNTFQPGKAWCPNPYVRGERDPKIWFMSDPAHWIKKVVTHWEKSKPNGPRYLRVPDFLVQLVLERCPPDPRHTPRKPEYGRTVGMEWYCRVFGRVYELLGGSRQPFYCSHDEDKVSPHWPTPPRLAELEAALSMVRAWHAHNMQLPNLTAKQRSSRGFSHQLFWDTQMMIEGFLGLLADLQQRHGRYVVRARMLNQDSLESLFGRVRMACGSGRDPSLLKVMQAVPSEEDKALARAGIRNTNSRAGDARTNSGQAGRFGEPDWMPHQRIVLPDRAAFARLCAAVRGQPETQTSSHEVLWQVLAEIQAHDQNRRLGDAKLMFWLTTAKHIRKTGFSRMRVNLAIAVLCGGAGKGAMMADVLQDMRYTGFPGTQ